MVEVKEEFRYRLIKAMDREGIRAADLARKTSEIMEKAPEFNVLRLFC